MGQSKAFVAWQAGRAEQIDRMERVHREITGAGAGRRWESEHLNGAIIARIVAEFQGFARDLHDEATDHVVGCLRITDPGLRALTRAAYNRGRALNSGNPTWNCLKDDFARFELRLQDDMDARYANSAKWRQRLDEVIFTRNAVVHADEDKLTRCRADGRLTLHRARSWRSSLNAMAAGMDRVTGAHLALLTGVRPW